MSDECQELYKNNDKRGCCNMPYSQVPEMQNENCHRECEVKESDPCCLHDCHVDVTDIYTDSKLNTNKFFNGYETYFKWANVSIAEQNEWNPVLRQSFEVCEKLSKSLTFLLECVRAEKIFLHKLSSTNNRQQL